MYLSLHQTLGGLKGSLQLKTLSEVTKPLPQRYIFSRLREYTSFLSNTLTSEKIQFKRHQSHRHAIASQIIDNRVFSILKWSHWCNLEKKNSFVLHSTGGFDGCQRYIIYWWARFVLLFQMCYICKYRSLLWQRF